MSLMEDWMICGKGIWFDRENEITLLTQNLDECLMKK